jgi:hypothetical protein
MSDQHSDKKHEECLHGIPKGFSCRDCEFMADSLYPQSSNAATALAKELEDIGPEYLAKYRVLPKWHQRAKSLAFRILDVDWRSQEDRRATMVAEMACEIRDAVEEALQSATGALTAYIEELERRAAEQMEWEKHPKCEDDGVGAVMQVIANELRAVMAASDGGGHNGDKHEQG